jgi:hypothetical protein
MQIYFSDFFCVPPVFLEDYGAFNVSLINDLPLFIDPFLLFNSRKPEYQELHENIIRYLKFLRDKSTSRDLESGLLHSWYLFPEVKQNWLGFSKVGNSGLGLRDDFAITLHRNLRAIFTNFGYEKITKGSHLEKLCLVRDGVGRDKISDFTTNLIKEFLLVYTQGFALQHISGSLRRQVAINKVRFNYTTETWESGVFDLPFYAGDYVILTPKDMLTKDELWISKEDLYNDYRDIPMSIPNEQLRAQINNYFLSVLPPIPTTREIKEAISGVIDRFPEFLDYYVRYKEDNGASAVRVSTQRVSEAEKQYIEQIKKLSEILRTKTGFYRSSGHSYAEAFARVQFLQDVIENKDGYRLFYVNGQPITRENDLQIMYRLTWYAADDDVNREVNNGRGPADFKISRGSRDSTLVEFKLARNSQLERNLQHQVEIYQKASDAQYSIKVIIYFTASELARIDRILQKLELEDDPNIVLIDARADNKPSASKA